MLFLIELFERPNRKLRMMDLKGTTICIPKYILMLQFLLNGTILYLYCTKPFFFQYPNQLSCEMHNSMTMKTYLGNDDKTLLELYLHFEMLYFYTNTQ